MAENVIYADLNLPESTTPRILTVSDVQGSGCTYADVKVKSQDTNAAANRKSPGKSCCSRKHIVVAILVVIILVLVLAVYLIITYGPTAGSQNSSPTSSLIPEEALGCPPNWEKHGRKCYFFSTETGKDLKAFHEECTANYSDLVIIDDREELNYLLSQVNYMYYLLGLRYSQKEQKWKWINNMEHDPTLFNVSRPHSDHECAVIGPGNVESASCDGSSTTQNMCEKAATMSERHQKES